MLKGKEINMISRKKYNKDSPDHYTRTGKKSDILIKVSYIFLIPQLNLRILIKYIFWYLIRILKFNWGIRKICVKKKD